MKPTAPFGIVIALAGIGVGLYLDGGHIAQLLQPTAALIVLGGTAGAVVLQFPGRVIAQALKQLRDIFLGRQDPAAQLINDITRYAVLARRSGLLSLDKETQLVHDPFLRKGLMMAVDGVKADEIRNALEMALHAEAEQEELMPKVFEAAGGYAPTIGILGAVMGLIQVMQKLENMNEVGRGIAVAFVATIYGVGLANLLLLPCAGRLRLMVERRVVLRELMIEGVVAIVERSNPRAIESRLSIYLPPKARLEAVALHAA